MSICTHSSIRCSAVSNSLQSYGLSLPGSSIHGVLQARILEWAAIPFGRLTLKGLTVAMLARMWGNWDSPHCPQEYKNFAPSLGKTQAVSSRKLNTVYTYSVVQQLDSQIFAQEIWQYVYTQTLRLDGFLYLCPLQPQSRTIQILKCEKINCGIFMGQNTTR